MTTTAIRHRLGIEAPRQRVHEALATTAGLASWWTTDTTGDAGEGGTLDLRFGEKGTIRFDVVAAAPERVEWRGLPGGPDEWVGTTVRFDLDHQDGETVVLFTHDGWAEPVPFQAHCSTKWASFLLGMKSLLEGGEAAPYPGDVAISRWD